MVVTDAQRVRNSTGVEWSDETCSVVSAYLYPAVFKTEVLLHRRRGVMGLNFVLSFEKQMTRVRKKSYSVAAVY